MNDKHFTHDEVSLMSIYNAAGTREGLIAALTEMRGYLDAEEAELRELTDSALAKLRGIGGKAVLEVSIVGADMDKGFFLVKGDFRDFLRFCQSCSHKWPFCASCATQARFWGIFSGS